MKKKRNFYAFNSVGNRIFFFKIKFEEKIIRFYYLFFFFSKILIDFSHYIYSRSYNCDNFETIPDTSLCNHSRILLLAGRIY